MRSEEQQTKHKNNASDTNYLTQIRIPFSFAVQTMSRWLVSVAKNHSLFLLFTEWVFPQSGTRIINCGKARLIVLLPRPTFHLKVSCHEKHHHNLLGYWPIFSFGRHCIPCLETNFISKGKKLTLNWLPHSNLCD